ncbi:uncharacterized protein LOC133393115 [Anopheles gambiae]|uniref:uncharacterized protein LOC133393115 n=1 Tax=Anopheles gambiae TaxID=7165 RepID=UPI002AC94BE9|nr:uncharacterized protein LOC133393115 [Anopheles gambiae]
MIAAIFCGLKKPESVEEYLNPLVNELNLLHDNGITIKGSHITIKLEAIVADTPARAFIKGVKGHTGYASCLKCTAKGVYNKKSKTMTFPGINAPLRTHKGFEEDDYPGHRTSSTPLLNLVQLDIILHIIVGDPAIVVLKDHLPENVYEHFILLFCGVTLLSSQAYEEKWALAGQLLDKFVTDFPIVYDEQYMSINIHNLQHVYEEVKRFRSFSAISTYPFEAKLHFLKRLLRSGWKSLEQVIKRISELEEFDMPKDSNISYPSIIVKGKKTSVHVRKSFVLQNNVKKLLVSYDRQQHNEVSLSILRTGRRRKNVSQKQ